MWEQIKMRDSDNGPGVNEPFAGPELLDTLGDLGVSKYAKTSEEDLATLLGFPDRRPVIFNAYRSISGETSPEVTRSWEAGSQDENADAQPVCMMWHQLVGTACMTDRFFTEKKCDAQVSGILLSDTVGLGKTIQVMGLYSMLLQVKLAQENKDKPLPPILGEPITLDGALRAP